MAQFALIVDMSDNPLKSMGIVPISMMARFFGSDPTMNPEKFRKLKQTVRQELTTAQ